MSKLRFTEPEITTELVHEHGLSDEEYQKICDYLGRKPTFTELGVYSVMWSEHCSYKNSIAVLKTLPRSGPSLLVGAGEENAGLVDIGDGLACAFKIESHNHPSAVEPYQGAATGVGGIHRDIFTMGARPVASLNSLRFGSMEEPRVRYLVDGVVRGIADYGNSFGVPTVAGEVYFDKSYQGNPLVNAMSAGIVKHGETASAIAPGVGNPVIIVGASTGRDGIHGATFASEEISEASEAKRPSVQVGDPFTEKLLLEASLEALKTGAVLGIQDMGAAGISCSSSEMSAKSGTGMRIDLDKVPLREEDMSAYEILLSESQERMLIVAQKGREQEVMAVFDKWDLNAVVIVHVTGTGRVTYLRDGEVKADIPAHSLVLGGGAPVYIREAVKPEYLDITGTTDLSNYIDIEDIEGTMLKLFESPNIASKRWVYEQYDHMVRTNTVTGPGPSDAGVVRIKGTNKALALSTDCNGRYVYLNPRKGGQIAVAEAARNVVCSGGRPMAITNCLNFGNPYKPEVYWTFKEAVGGMGDACRVLETPVTGGNVSFYNENPQGAVFPTPVIGMLGLIEDYQNHTTKAGFRADGDDILYAGASRSGIDGSEYLSFIHGVTAGDAPDLDLEFEAMLQRVLLDLIRKGWIASAHDLSDGGLAVALMEKAVFSGKGARIALNMPGQSATEMLFSEAQSGILLSVSPEHTGEVMAGFAASDVPAYHLGSVGGDRVIIEDLADMPVARLKDIYEGVLPGALSHQVST